MGRSFCSYGKSYHDTMTNHISDNNKKLNLDKTNTSMNTHCTISHSTPLSFLLVSTALPLTAWDSSSYFSFSCSNIPRSNNGAFGSSARHPLPPFFVLSDLSFSSFVSPSFFSIPCRHYKEDQFPHGVASTNAVLIPFDSSDFELKRHIGNLGYIEVVEWEYYDGIVDPTRQDRTVVKSPSTVRLYDARIVTGELRNSRVLLKEFVGDQGVQVGLNEADIYEKLVNAAPDDKNFLPGPRTQKVIPPDWPVASLLGSFRGGDAFQTLQFQMNWNRAFAKAGDPPRKGSPWLVFRWEGLYTPMSYARADQPPEFFDRFMKNRPFQRKSKYVRKLMNLSLHALGFFHRQGLIHRSLGPSSLLLNTVLERDIEFLDVKLKDFGFSTSLSNLDEKILKEARNNNAFSPGQIARYLQCEDIYALSYTFLQIILWSFSSVSTIDDRRLSQESLKRIFEDVYTLDMDRIRAFIEAEDIWNSAVTLLNESDGAGWNFFAETLALGKVDNRGKTSLDAESLTQHPFVCL